MMFTQVNRPGTSIVVKLFIIPLICKVSKYWKTSIINSNVQMSKPRHLVEYKLAQSYTEEQESNLTYL